MTTINGFYTRDEAAKVLGVNRNTIKRFVADGRLQPYHKMVGRHYLYEKKEVERLKRTMYPEGMTFLEIAQKYGIARNTVKSHFKRLGIKPLGRNKRVQSYVFDPDTVGRAATFLGWRESQRDEPSPPTGAASTDA